MISLSIDHEFLTKQGWKRYVTTSDEVAVLTTPISFVKPIGVKTTEAPEPLIFIDADKINVFGTGSTCIIDAKQRARLHECHANYKAQLEYPTCTSYKTYEDANAAMITTILEGRHATLRERRYLNVLSDYELCVYNDNLVLSNLDPSTFFKITCDAKGCFVINITMPDALPICTRRQGKVCWVTSS